MPLPSSTLNEIYLLIIGDIEAALAQTIPIIPKAVWRRLAKALAGAWLILYKYGTALHRERFVQTATITYLRYLGELVRIFQQAATTWQGQAGIVCTGSTGTIPAGTQFIRNATGVVYTVDTEIAITPGTLTLDLTAGSSGDIGSLNVSDVLDIVSPLPGVGMTATVSAVTVSGDDAESAETYRTRVLNRYRRKPQGGAVSDYEQWGLDCPNVINVYPYPAALPGDIDIYIEVDNQPDGIPTPAQLVEALDYFLYDPVTDRRNRAPLTATINVLPISRQTYNVGVYNLTPDTPAARAAIDVAIDNYLQERAPYIRGLHEERRDSISRTELSHIIITAIQPYSATITEIVLVGLDVIDFTICQKGQRALLGTVTYVP